MVEACGTTELGTVPIQISEGAYKFGMDALATKNADIEDLKTNLEKGLPIIALIDPSPIYGGIAGFGHFIIIVGMENNKILYHDPDIQDGDFKVCEVDKFFNAWNIFKNWMIICKQ